MRKIIKKLFILFLAYEMFADGCTGNRTPTSGTAVVGCDEAVAPAIEKQRLEFMNRYPDADIRMRWLNQLLAESLFTARQLDMFITLSPTALNKDTDNGKVTGRATAWDGLAVIVHRSNPVTSLSRRELTGILTGKMKTWKDIRFDAKIPADSIILIMEDDASGNVRSLRELLQIQSIEGTPGISIPEDSVQFASARVLESVAGKPGALGFISTTWLCDNPDYRLFRSMIRTLAWRSEADSFTVMPVPGYLYTGDYPLRRAIYAYTREDDHGPAAGFMGFMCGHEGQILFLESHTAPAVSPVKIKYE